MMFIIVSILGGCKQENIVPPVEKAPPYNANDFTSAQVCSTCHPQQFDEWNGSMHRYSSNDPVWKQAISSLQGSTQGKLRDWCWQCHAPIGFLIGKTLPTFEFDQLSVLAREGVTCDLCHIMKPQHSTSNQLVRYNINPGSTKFAALVDPIPTGFHENGYDASYTRSEACRECHDLIVNNVPVEITFTEWQNSAWGAMSVECQDCHMTKYNFKAAVGGPDRVGLRHHDFIGVDVAMTDWPNKPQQRAMVDSMLKNAACMSIDVASHASASDTLPVSVRVCNDRTGHNLPTSVFFFRQMWIELTIWSGTDTAYRTGYLDANGDLMDKNSLLQPNADRDLVTFGGILYKDGQESNVFELDSLVNTSIPPFGSRTARYAVIVPHAGAWNVKARLLFRPFGPYLFRAVGADQYISEIPTFEMISRESVIVIH